MAVRSISLPSGLNPASLRLEQEVNKLKALEVEEAMSSTSSSVQLQARVVALSDVYASLTDLIQTPSTQKYLTTTQQGGSLVEETLEASVSLINTCSSCRDLVSSLKDHVRDLHSVLRRRRKGSSHASAAAAAAYVGFRKKSHKEVARIDKELKRTEQRSSGAGATAASYDEAGELMVSSGELMLLREVASVSITTLRALLSFLSGKCTWKERSSSRSSMRWSMMISRALRMRRADDGHGLTEMDGVDCAARSMMTRKSKEEVEVDMEALKRRLRALDCAAQSLENALDALFRRFLQNRVSLLNILTHRLILTT